MTSIPTNYWDNWVKINTSTAIFHQWEQLEASGCINNFRIAAGKTQGVHAGWFFADSDAYKWLDAASRLLSSDFPEISRLGQLVEEFVSLLVHAQMPDGYLYTYNQIHFPGSRWENLLIEHELYCLGHFIEACVSHYEVTGTQTALSLAKKSADLLVKEFSSGPPLDVDGHEEIEIALLRFFQVTKSEKYLQLASSFLERRGRKRFITPYVLIQNIRTNQRKKKVNRDRESYQVSHPEYIPYQLPESNYTRSPRNSRLRWIMSALSGKYFQIHAPIRKQTTPEGHAVRFGYLETAVAMLARITRDQSLSTAMVRAWEQLISRKMYLTGGLGAIPGLEGFGRDEELDPLYAYAETCAAIASIYWNWEMGLITHESKYGDMIEWQLYNAFIVGMGLTGKNYLYNNPLASHGGIKRLAWFAVPCCPSNLSRTLASLGKYNYSYDDHNLWVHQYISGKGGIGDKWFVSMESFLPWEGKVTLEINPIHAGYFTINLRRPSWAGNANLLVNGEMIKMDPPLMDLKTTASGYDPRSSAWISISKLWKPGDTIQVEFDMPIKVRRASLNDKTHRRKIALTRGPLVFCLENKDNPGIDIFSASIDLAKLNSEFSPHLLGGTQIITALTTNKSPLLFIPYHLWANRGESLMTVWINCDM